ncbi:hypothetical protein SAMN05216332_103188 [Nitrosospira briensis]|nr:hypothetical protein SAMN05216332_103188 [Nitrosospira briensis]
MRSPHSLLTWIGCPLRVAAVVEQLFEVELSNFLQSSQQQIFNQRLLGV